MDNMIHTGKNVDDAIKKALAALNLTRDKVEIEVIDAGSRGLLGFIASREAKIRVKRKIFKEDLALDFVKNIVEKMGLNIDFSTTYDQENPQQFIIMMNGENLGVLIGKRGQTIDSLQYLTNLAANKVEGDDYLRVILDAENYRDRRRATLADLAKKMAEKAKKSGRKVILEPMSPQERRIVHLTLQEDDKIRTFSEGGEPYRKVIIVPNKTQ